MEAVVLAGWLTGTVTDICKSELEAVMEDSVTRCGILKAW